MPPWLHGDDRTAFMSPSAQATFVNRLSAVTCEDDTQRVECPQGQHDSSSLDEFDQQLHSDLSSSGGSYQTVTGACNPVCRITKGGESPLLLCVSSRGCDRCRTRARGNPSRDIPYRRPPTGSHRTRCRSARRTRRSACRRSAGP